MGVQLISRELERSSQYKKNRTSIQLAFLLTYPSMAHPPTAECWNAPWNALSNSCELEHTILWKHRNHCPLLKFWFSKIWTKLIHSTLQVRSSPTHSQMHPTLPGHIHHLQPASPTSARKSALITLWFLLELTPSALTLIIVGKAVTKKGSCFQTLLGLFHLFISSGQNTTNKMANTHSGFDPA
jgi:hypothetical protein